MMKVILGSGGINWSWFTLVELNLDSHTAAILSHYRLHNERDILQHPVTDGWCRIHEMSDRTASNLEFTLYCLHPTETWTWRISNPMHIFSYPSE